MSRKFSIQKPARRDLTAHVEYIARDSTESAHRLMDRFTETVEDLVLMPEMGRDRSFSKKNLEGIRCIPIKDFPKYLIFYRSAEEGIVVLRVLHSARDINRLLGF